MSFSQLYNPDERALFETGSAVLDGRWDDAIVFLDKVKGLEDKEAARLTGGQTVRALADAHASLGPDPDPEALRAEFRTQFAGRIDPLARRLVADAQAVGQLSLVLFVDGHADDQVGVGFIAPPLGLSLFVVSGLTGESILKIAADWPVSQPVASVSVIT